MEWLNYHHLRYFWAAAKAGSLKQAAAELNVSQPSISVQIKELEDALGEPLFRRSGRSNVLTEAGQIAFRYAEEIFALGTELTHAVKQRPGSQSMRLYAGVADSIPKLVANEILNPVLAMPQKVHVICREGKIQDLLSQLAAHRLDIVLSDEPAPTSIGIRTFSHLLGETGVSLCAEARLAKKLKPGFPASLDGAPALLPADNTALRRSLESWFRGKGIRPRVLAEFEDIALMKVVAADGKGFIPVPSVVREEARTRYRFHEIGIADGCEERYYAISAERRITHPAVTVITGHAQQMFKPLISPPLPGR